MAYQYPRNQLDNAEYLLSFLGSFWTNVFEGNDLVQETVFARGQLDAQAYLQFLDLIRACSRYTVPVFHTDNWYFLRFKESEVNQAVLATYQEGGPRVFTANQALSFGTPEHTSLYYVACPPELNRVQAILNRITGASLTLVEGLDYWRPEPGLLAFRSNPFADDRMPMRDVYDTTGNVVDREAGLWLFRGEFDWDTVYQQFGYALNLKMASSEGYRQLVCAILEGLSLGITERSLHMAWSAVTGVPLAWERGTVELIQEDANNLVIVTDRQAYSFARGATPLVAVGDVVRPGDPLTDALQFFEFGDGRVDPQITGLSVGRGILANDFYAPLRFENEIVPLCVETADDGLTKVSFEIHGYPGDIEKFWNDVHQRGKAQGKTLAHYLDLRAAPDSEPTAASLPATVNPLEFLCSNLLRYHVLVVRVRASLLGSSALGMPAADQIRRLIPPEKLMIVIMEMTGMDAISMAAAGTEDAPGCQEALTASPCGAIVETLSIADVAERVRITQTVGKCV